MRAVERDDRGAQWGLLMLYWLAEWLGFPGALNLIRYLSFRSGAAVRYVLTKSETRKVATRSR